MILALEILMTLGGLYLLVFGKNPGRDSVAHHHFRVLGAFMVTVLPAVLVAQVVLAAVWLATHPGATRHTFETDAHWLLVGAEFGVVVVYAVVTGCWDAALRRRLATVSA